MSGSAAPAPTAAGRALRGRTSLRRRRPVLVALWALFASDGGALGPAARRRLWSRAARGAPLTAAAATSALVALRAFARPRLGAVDAVVLLAAGAALAAVCWRRAHRAAEGRAAGAREQLEIGVLFVAGALAAAQLAEGALPRDEAPLFPIVYLVLALLGASFHGGVAVTLAALFVALDVLGWRSRGGDPAALPAVLAHAGLAVLFGVAARAVLAARLAAAGRAERAAVSRRLREIDERARAYRVLGAGAEDAAPDAARRRADEAAAVEVEAAVRGVLEVVEAALRAHTAAVFVTSVDDDGLKLHECRSASDAVSRRTLPPGGEGILGAALRGGPVRVEGSVAATWYDDGTRPAAALAVPLLDAGGRARGVLVADRIEPAPFEARDERILATLAAEIVRAMQAERLMADLRRARDESGRFYEALERLNRTTKGRDVLDALLEVAASTVPLDFGAVTLAEESPAGTSHRIARVAAIPDTKPMLEETTFPDGAGLVASAVRLGASLPGREIDLAKAVVFDESTRLRGLASLKVLPLKTGDRVLGTLVVGARRRAAYGPDAVRQLEVIAMQAAEAILRARLFDETERLATTDGLTGLLNHRTFQARFDEQLAQALRYGKPLALLLADVDHFKKVNDTHGHPIGDEVLRAVAAVLGREARASDVVARYGGEEFAILMPETDAAGALAIAERIRGRVAAAPFPTGRGPIPVTLSAGVAAFPASGRSRATLVARADAALYAAKRGGRNRTVSAGAAPGEGPPAAP